MALITSRLCIASRWSINSPTVIFGNLTLTNSKNSSAGLSVLEVSKALITFLVIPNLAAKWGQFCKPSLCLSKQKAISPMTSGSLSSRLHTKVSSFSVNVFPEKERPFIACLKQQMLQGNFSRIPKCRGAFPKANYRTSVGNQMPKSR